MAAGELRGEVLRASRKRLAIRLHNYVFLLERQKDTINIEVYRILPNSDVEPVVNANGVDQLAEELGYETQDLWLLENRAHIADILQQYIALWDQLAKRYYVRRLLQSVPGGSTGRVKPGGLESGLWNQLPVRENANLPALLDTVSKLYSPTVSEALEVVLTVGLTVRSVDRQRGVTEPRPLWLLLVGPPGSFKSTVLKMLSKSSRVLMIEDVTPAGLVPAKGDVPPLVLDMDGHVTILPTLSLVASQRKEETRRLFSFLEAIYDGRIARKTGVSDYQEYYVDTVVLAAITNDVYRMFSDVFLSYGSRWLIWYMNLTREESLEIAERLTRERPAGLQEAVSGFFDSVVERLSPEDFTKPYIAEEEKRELRTLATLLASLRVVVRRDRSFSEEEGRWVEEVVVTQYDMPSRAYMQLLQFVRANTLLRKHGEADVVGLPQVDKHAMKLAARLALSSTTPEYTRIIEVLLEAGGRVEGLRELAKRARVSYANAWRRLQGLEATGVINIVEGQPVVIIISDEYLQVLQKYLAPK